MKIKDVVQEGFASSFGKALLPQALQKAIDVKKPKAPPTYVDLAQAAHAQFGDNPESVFPGFVGWLTDQQRKELVDAKEKLAKQKERQQAQTKQSRGKRQLAKDVFGAPPEPAAAPPAAQSAAPLPTQPAQSAPAQVRLPSGQYVTKHAGNWYDEAGERIAIPGDIERLERMARGPSGQSQMSGTKNIPVDLPGYRRKKK